MAKMNFTNVLVQVERTLENDITVLKLLVAWFCVASAFSPKFDLDILKIECLQFIY